MPCGQCSVHAETMRDTKECSGGWDAAPALCLVRLNEICTFEWLRQTLATGIRNWGCCCWQPSRAANTRVSFASLSFSTR